MPTCDILLAVYNGTLYGPALLDSLLAQDYQDFRLLVRDNGSTDGTIAMLRQYEPKFCGRMRVVEKGQPTGSPVGNFSYLMEEADADYVLFADHDDVWLPGKVGYTVKMLEQAQRQVSSETPVYAFTDVTPVDGALTPKGDSFWAFRRVDPALSQQLNRSLICATMLGCASGINRALLRLATPVPPAATGHDWWALLIACALGKVVFSHERTMLYRLHGDNASDPKKVSLLSYYKSENRVAKVRRGMKRRVEQAEALLNAFGPAMSAENRAVVQRFVNLQRQNYLARRYTLLRGLFLYPDLPRNLAMFAAG